MLAESNQHYLKNISFELKFHYKLTQSPNGEQIAISPKTQWGSESIGEKEIIDKNP